MSTTLRYARAVSVACAAGSPRSIARAFLGACALLATSSMAGAQEDLGLLIGTRVRVTVGNAQQRIAGTLAATNPDSLRINLTAAQRTFALKDVRVLERSLVSRRRTLEGALLGLGVGGATVWLVQSRNDSEVCTQFPNCIADETVKRTGAALLIVALGAGFGAMIGHSIISDRWEPVFFRGPSSPDSRLTPRIRAPYVGVALRF